jgi:hypothetical protein
MTSEHYRYDNQSICCLPPVNHFFLPMLSNASSKSLSLILAIRMLASRYTRFLDAAIYTHTQWCYQLLTLTYSTIQSTVCQYTCTHGSRYILCSSDLLQFQVARVFGNSFTNLRCRVKFTSTYLYHTIHTFRLQCRPVRLLKAQIMASGVWVTTVTNPPPPGK